MRDENKRTAEHQKRTAKRELQDEKYGVSDRPAATHKHTFGNAHRRHTETDTKEKSKAISWCAFSGRRADPCFDTNQAVRGLRCHQPLSQRARGTAEDSYAAGISRPWGKCLRLAPDAVYPTYDTHLILFDTHHDDGRPLCEDISRREERRITRAPRQDRATLSVELSLSPRRLH